jgi:hypothetical protein
MQSKALERWADVEEKTSSSLLQENGLLFYGEDTGVTVEGSVLGAKEVMENLGLPHKFYATGNDIADAYPALESCRGKPYSGYVTLILLLYGCCSFPHLTQIPLQSL